MWWRQVPVGLMRAYVAMLPRLQAEESMRTANAVSAGTGSLEKKAAKRLWERWERDARGGQARPARKVPPELLRALGFGLHVKGTPPVTSRG